MDGLLSYRLFSLAPLRSVRVPMFMLDTWLLKPALAWIATAVLLAKLVTWRRKVKMLPPGPPKYPIVDNLFNMPLDLDWVKFLEIGKRYDSEFIHLSALGNNIVVLNSLKVAQDLLEKRSGIYSSRPAGTMTHELSGFTVFFGFLPYGERWRTCRRLFTKHVGTGSMPANYPREKFYARRLLTQLLDEPDRFLDHVQNMVGSIAISMAYGLKARPSGDPHIELAANVGKAVCGIADAGAFLVDIVPALKHIPSWVPGAGFKKQAENCNRLSFQVRDDLFNAAKRTMESPDYLPSFVSEGLQNLEQVKGAEEDVETLKDVAAMVYMAAADTTWSGLGTFFLAMVCYPEVQRKLQQELDDALGSGRLPDHEDIQDLPYLTAVFLEIIRWKPVTPIGVPHEIILDDLYEGSLIPKGSVVIANQWAMLHNPDDFPDPSEFRPERFLKDGKIDRSVLSPEDIAFGFGRRMCPGRHIARSVIMLTAASVLSSFDLKMKKDEQGRPIKPKQEYHLSFISHPKDFPCDIVPRTNQAKELIMAWDSAEGDNPP